MAQLVGKDRDIVKEKIVEILKIKSLSTIEIYNLDFIKKEFLSKSATNSVLNEMNNLGMINKQLKPSNKIGQISKIAIWSILLIQ